VKLLADERCDALMVAGLRADGHDVLYVKESARGATDVVILQLGAEQQRILLTEDKDFGELVVRLGLPSYGIILLRVAAAASDIKLTRLQELLDDPTRPLAGCLVVVDEEKARIRPLRPLSPPAVPEVP
jgi:predicted nuclease of predicted toxin-antitoxin system